MQYGYLAAQRASSVRDFDHGRLARRLYPNCKSTDRHPRETAAGWVQEEGSMVLGHQYQPVGLLNVPTATKVRVGIYQVMQFLMKSNVSF
jgi:type II secretory ATPase GspE/PulE/Tfp pilus assembly ATPase PilB-like protein